MKSALVLAGGISQAALICELKLRGYKTILADMNPNCYAASFADEFQPISAMDYEGLYEYAAREHVDMVITACADQILLAETYVCEKLGLRSYISHETAKKISDKMYMKEIFKKNNIPSSKFVTLDTFDSNLVSSLQFPVIVKPVDTYSARGVRKCNDMEEAERNFNNALKTNRKHKAVIIEEYKEGQELTVEFYVENGKAKLLCCGGKEKLKNGLFASYGSIYPAPISEEVKQKIIEIGQGIAEAFGLINSPMLVQLITDGTDAFVLEFSPRTGGFIKYEIVNRMSGFDPIKTIVDLHEGIVPHFEQIRPEKNYLISCFLYCDKGILNSYSGFDEAKKEGLLTKYWQVRPKGFQFKHIESNGDRAACFITQDDTYEGVIAKYIKAKEMVKVLDQDGNNLIRLDLMKKG